MREGRTAIQKKAGGRTVGKVEKVTAGRLVSYEAEVKTRAGKVSSVAVNGDGSVHQ